MKLGKRITLNEMTKLTRAELMAKYDAADLCSSAYANRNSLLSDEFRKVFSIAHSELLKRQQIISSLREQLSLVDASAITDIATERKRQREVEDWSSDHDDGHSKGELAAAAACYAMGRCIVEGSIRIAERRLTKNLWPWSLKWWKPKDRRRNLVRAGALIVAEIERIDRASAIRMSGGGK